MFFSAIKDINKFLISEVENLNSFIELDEKFSYVENQIKDYRIDDIVFIRKNIILKITKDKKLKSLTLPSEAIKSYGHQNI